MPCELLLLLPLMIEFRTKITFPSLSLTVSPSFPSLLPSLPHLFSVFLSPFSILTTLICSNPLFHSSITYDLSISSLVFIVSHHAFCLSSLLQNSHPYTACILSMLSCKEGGWGWHVRTVLDNSTPRTYSTHAVRAYKISSQRITQTDCSRGDQHQ